MGCGPLVSHLPPPREDDKLLGVVSGDSLVCSHNYSPRLTCVCLLVNDKQRRKI